MEPERRRYHRGNPSEEILAILAPTPTLARVKDLSQGGLRLEYVTGAKSDCEWSHVNLFLTESKVYLPGLSFRLVYDRQADDEALPALFLNRRECGLEFEALSGLQAGQIQNIMHRLLSRGA